MKDTHILIYWYSIVITVTVAQKPQSAKNTATAYWCVTLSTADLTRIFLHYWSTEIHHTIKHRKKSPFFHFIFLARDYIQCAISFSFDEKKTNPYMHNVYAPSKRMYWFDGSSIECTQQQQHYVGGNIESRWHKAKLSQSKPGILRSVFKSILDAIKSNSRMLSIST